MKIRTDFVTNSSSSSFTTIIMDSPLLEKWLKVHKKISLNEYAETIAERVNGDGSGYECCSGLSDEFCCGVTDMLLYLMGDEYQESDMDLYTFLSQHKEKIDECSTVKIYCASQFEGDAPMITRMIYRNSYPAQDCYSLEEMDEESVETLLADVPEFDLLSAFTPEVIDRLLESVANYDDEDCDEET